ncbi:hypothetical protein [Embleya scabrispora]|uniref:hypothetical protein n=1 Tax=Embleya scabrispora TaxID=159449 RepID=UPI000372AC7E|nr:hypothetical protein [Embleya scabrispora]MYS85443.1 hypothetical protein [Streptomyces sp. SID5474]
MAAYDFDGHRFASEATVDYRDPDAPIEGLVATCSCGWRGGEGPQHIERGRPGGSYHLYNPYDVGEAEQAAKNEWLDEHITEFGPLAPAALADQIRSIGEQLDTLIREDQPMAALAAIRLSDGYFARQARDAALRASFLDNSWSEIGEALGISKQAAWERYGKARPQKTAS